LSSKESVHAQEQLTKQRDIRRAGPRMRNEEIANGKNCESFVSCSCELLHVQAVIYHVTRCYQETMSIQQVWSMPHGDTQRAKKGSAQGEKTRAKPA